MSISVQQSNPKANYLAHKNEIDAAIHRVLDSGWYILGQEVDACEREFASYLGAGHAVGVASGTDAIHVALLAGGIGPGDLVYTVSHTAVATVAAIGLCGAIPVFVDIDPVSFTMDPQRLEEDIRNFDRNRAKAVVPVHLYGHPADMPAIMDIASRYGLHVVEDCAQSHGASLHGKMTGTWGHSAAFSFYPTKNLGALGDGGMVATNDAALAAQIRLLREYGWKERYVSDIPGMNTRLDELQAAILRVKLQYLDQDNESRRKITNFYQESLDGNSLILPRSKPGVVHANHQFVVRTPARNMLKAHLRELGIATLVHYPVPVHLQPAYAGYAVRAHLQQTEAAAREVLSLPLYPELSEDQVKSVTEQIKILLAR